MNETPEAVTPVIDLLLSMKDLEKILSLSNSTIFRMTKSGILPPPRIIGKSQRWRASDINAFIDGLNVAGCMPK